MGVVLVQTQLVVLFDAWQSARAEHSRMVLDAQQLPLLTSIVCQSRGRSN